MARRCVMSSRTRSGPRRELWDAAGRRRSPTGYRVLRYDHARPRALAGACPGPVHGRRSSPATPLALLDHLGIERVALLRPLPRRRGRPVTLGAERSPGASTGSILGGDRGGLRTTPERWHPPRRDSSAPRGIAAVAAGRDGALVHPRLRPIRGASRVSTPWRRPRSRWMVTPRAATRSPRLRPARPTWADRAARPAPAFGAAMTPATPPADARGDRAPRFTGARDASSRSRVPGHLANADDPERFCRSPCWASSHELRRRDGDAPRGARRRARRPRRGRQGRVHGDFQELITRYAWGEIWTRPGLDRQRAAASR